MIGSNLPGTALTALCLAASPLGLTSCSRETTLAPHAQAAQDDLKEVHALVQGIKDHPEMQPGSDSAGPPIQVDPYPHSSGMSGMGHQMGEKWNADHSSSHPPKQ